MGTENERIINSIRIKDVTYNSVEENITIGSYTEEEFADNKTVLNLNKSMEASFSAVADEAAYSKLVWLSLQQAIRDAIWYMCGICPNRRVVHHYMTSKKFRTRKKNFKRMEKCIRRGR